MSIRSVPLGGTHRVEWTLTNPSTGGHISASALTSTEVEIYIGGSGYPVAGTSSADLGAVDGVHAIVISVSAANYAVNDLVNVLLRVEFDGTTYTRVLSTFIVDPPALIGTVTEGTATRTAGTFKSNIREGYLLEDLVTPALWLRSSDGISVSGAEVTAWAPFQGTGTFSQASSTLRPLLSSGAVSFDGTDDYMTTANAVANQASTGLTIALRITVDSTSGTQTFMGKGDLSSCDWAVQLVSNEFRFWVNGYTNGGYVTSFFPSTGTYTVIIVYDGFGSTNADKVRFWLDGVESTLSFYGTIPSSIGNGGYAFALGALSSGNQPFNGVFTEMFFSKSAANPAQVDQISVALTTQRDDFWKGNLLLFTKGDLTGQVRKITGFSRTTGFFSFASAYTQAPAVGDTFLILAS